ncbi:peptidase S8/S53 domain-containing protein [Hypoxylon trugodes]|uniref:peptidase S8/S53 domain-containing protein n=1 Tax=Hypoxylon trugodes TaxID=326681 RepID=UPI00219C3B60|nr:peptidase S8/S53 domain-containing protein [Hypoxylon trugodes]KAI1390516.1 peptidase S8/S53 domain-containing protein [Hypoxylon trugodes]
MASTSSTPAAEDSQSSPDVKVTYVIYPKDGTNKADVETVENYLKFYSEESSFYTSQTKTVGVNFWLAKLSHRHAQLLTTALAKETHSIYPQLFGRASNVISQHPDPTTAIHYQDYPFIKEAPIDHLAFVCQEEGRSLKDYRNRYYFDDSEPLPGRGVPVYVVDTGANLDHKEFRRIRQDVEWIHIGEDINAEENAEDDSGMDPLQLCTEGKSHGTAMLSLVTGERLGVSKAVKPYLVRVPRCRVPTVTSGNASSGATLEHWLEAVSKVCDHLTETSAETKAIMLMAFQVERKALVRHGVDHAKGFDCRIFFLLQNLVSMGVLPITGAGNNTQMGNKIDGLPANFGRTNYERQIPELLVVGGIHTTEFNLVAQTDFDRGLPHIFAPAFGLRVANGNYAQWARRDGKDGEYRGTKGSSCAAAITAGLAAYFWRLVQIGSLGLADKSPLGLKNYIISDELKWSRCSDVHGRELPAIWNGAIMPTLSEHVQAQLPPPGL